MRHSYQTEDTCSSEINFDVTDGIVTDIEFIGGCNGNLKAIAVLLEGLPVETVVDKLKGITCGRRPTSCADQLATALLKTNNKFNNEGEVDELR